jgi:Peptidase family M28
LIDIRIYRAALLPVLAALVVVMFSLQERPQPLASTLAPDAFDAKGAYATLRELTRAAPDRRPGSEGDDALAGIVEGRLRGLSGAETARDDFVAPFDGDDTPMTNVTATLSGPSDRQIVVLAHRDAARRPGASSAADTAVLLELAKALAGVRHSKTIVFVSTDGGEADSAGARRFAERYPDRDKVDAVLVLGDVGSASARRPYLVSWSNDTSRSSLQLIRTANTALAREGGSGAGSASVPGQFIHLAWPLTLREQGPLVGNDLDAVTLTARGEVPRAPAGDTLDQISEIRLLHFGKAALGTALALDSAPELESSPSSYLSWDRRVLPGWAVSLLAFSLLAPVLAAGLDGLARARRRGHAVGRWLRWTLGASVPFLLMLAAAQLFGLLDWMPRTASEALAPASRPSFAESTPALGGLALVFALGWLLARPLVVGPARMVGRPTVPEAGLAPALVLALALLLLWPRNPFAVLLLVPAAHLCLLCALPAPSARPRFLAPSAIAAALLLPALVVLYYGSRLDLGFDVSRYALLFVAGGGSPWNVLLVSLIAGSLLSLTRLVLARPEPERLPEITVRGPRTYAGPGSLGGTESALKR